MVNGEAQRFWDTRHSSADRWVKQRAEDPESLRRRGAWRTSTTYINVTLLPSLIQEYRERAARELAPLHLAVKDSGIWGIPELFSVRFQHLDPTSPSAPDEVEEGMDRGLALAHELGGSMEYCHGVGLRLAHMMAAELGEGLEALRRIKRALDPDWLMNPGKLAL
jgi:FAD/FMN-containing dehydrogenase